MADRLRPIPLKWSRRDGLVTVTGSVALDGDDLVIRLAEAALELVPIGEETFVLPADEIESIDVERRLWGCRLRVRVFSPHLVAGFPDTLGDEIVLRAARKHTAEAEALAQAVRLRNL